MGKILHIPTLKIIFNALCWGVYAFENLKSWTRRLKETSLFGILDCFFHQSASYWKGSL